MMNCFELKTHDSRVKRCEELKICKNCSSTEHSQCSIPLDISCFECKANDHISALCTKYVAKISNNSCINSCTKAGRTFILSSMMVSFGAGEENGSARILIGTDSMRLYISYDLADRLKMSRGESKNHYKISTFVDISIKNFHEQVWI